FQPFTRLSALLDATPPGRSPAGDGAPLLLSVGEPQGQPPAFLAEALTQNAALWSRYPPPLGDPDYRRACAEWLVRRYRLPRDLVDPERNILPLPGTREGLFFAALAAMKRGENGGGARDAILLPDPGYHVYGGAAAVAGARLLPVAADEASGFLPDYEALEPALLARVALAFFCSPSNPQGAVASRARWRDLIQLARRHGFLLAADECYGELYGDAPAPGALEAAAELGEGLGGLLAFHSLSKRSSAPGLRCGFAVGDAAWIAALDRLLRLGGAGVPLPSQAAGARLWRDEAHVAANRARYRESFEIAERVLGNRFGYRKPGGGFFLWLEVGDGEAAARTLWRAAGIRVLPGAYLSAPGSASLPGAAYIRAALVYEPPVIAAALGRMAEIL
ncbi:MAG: aminotransferase class I/II-fold pyridoxal phosphate-dependent enzyme, partial [Kiloniellales bacterium]